jgi:hypothetical protein
VIICQHKKPDSNTTRGFSPPLLNDSKEAVHPIQRFWQKDRSAKPIMKRLYMNSQGST